MQKAVLAILLLAGLAGCGSQSSYPSADYQPNSAGAYSSSGAAAGWGDKYPNGFGYANDMTDPGPATAGSRR